MKKLLLMLGLVAVQTVSAEAADGQFFDGKGGVIQLDSVDRVEMSIAHKQWKEDAAAKADRESYEQQEELRRQVCIITPECLKYYKGSKLRVLNSHKREK